MNTERLQITITGAVQGVGFRPFIYRLATELGISGWVNNSAQGVMIEAEASRPLLDTFLQQIALQKPPHSLIQTLDTRFLSPVGYTGFEIHHSDGAGHKTAIVLPDLATCPECLKDIFDRNNRRYQYPFTNCTHCGPRFSIIEALPYDRPNTTMRDFIMCEQCRAEYENPLDRRFHAQPTACSDCGPQLALWGPFGRVLNQRHPALKMAAEALRRGWIVAVKGLGGFHLMVDARNPEAVERLRERKHRWEKPLAVMMPSLEQIKIVCEVSELEEQLLSSSAAPIVLLKSAESSKPSASIRPQTAEAVGEDVDNPFRGFQDGLATSFELVPTQVIQSPTIAENVAPRNPYLGVMLPYTPLHHLLLGELGFPVVATSGNLSGEPICIDEREALTRLGKIADLFLVHDRPITRHVDDSIVRVVAGREMILRRARGYAPLPIELPAEMPSLIAVGAHQKNTVAVTTGRQAFISQHVGDLDTPQADTAFQRVIRDFQQLYELKPQAVICDLHPDYRSTHYAEESGLPVIRVQHHYAHVLSCMAENHLDSPVLGIAWDGTGYGTDNTIWGGEFLHVKASPPAPPSLRGRGNKIAGANENPIRVAHFRTFPLPGGEQAVKEPRRSALGLLYSLFGDDLPADLPTVQAFSAAELVLLKQALSRGLNAPLTSSAGRLFDAVASLIGLRQRTSFEGQAAMELEFACDGLKTDECYQYGITPITGENDSFRYIIDGEMLIGEIITDWQAGVVKGLIALKFHNTLAEMMVSVARLVGEKRVVLTGGCFQNKLLLEQAISRLLAAGFEPYWHQHIPPNDGGIALGQIVAGALQME